MRECANKFISELTKDELDLINQVLSSEKYTDLHLEIGTAAGGTLAHIYNFYKESKRCVPDFIVVDPMKYFPLQEEIICENLNSVGVDLSKIRFIKNKSHTAFHDWNNDKFDFILIDGNHKVRHVMSDLRWTRFLNAGGVLCMHDYNRAFPGVYRSVRRFLRKYPNYSILDSVGNLLIIKKNSNSLKTEISTIDLIWANTLNPIHQIKVSVRKRRDKLKSFQLSY